jgi:hypothetical protein
MPVSEGYPPVWNSVGDDDSIYVVAKNLLQANKYSTAEGSCVAVSIANKGTSNIFQALEALESGNIFSNFLAGL